MLIKCHTRNAVLKKLQCLWYNTNIQLIFSEVIKYDCVCRIKKQTKKKPNKQPYCYWYILMCRNITKANITTKILVMLLEKQNKKGEGFNFTPGRETHYWMTLHPETWQPYWWIPLVESVEGAIKVPCSPNQNDQVVCFLLIDFNACVKYCFVEYITCVFYCMTTY